MFENTKKLCDSLLGLGLPGFDLSVYIGGESAFRYMGGYSSLEEKTPISGNERYNIYSCSKVITCTAAMKLFERGLFSLEDKLSDYMPEFGEMRVVSGGSEKRAETPIRIKNLFEMNAGFSYNCATAALMEAREKTDGRCPTRETMKYLAKDRLLFEPGERYQYSLCHDVIAALVEVISGEKFENFVKREIFDKAGMSMSTFMLTESEIETIAEQYRFTDGAPKNVGKHISTYKLGSEYASGGAGCISTVDDYMKFLEALRTYKLVSPETLKLMTTDRLTDSTRSTYTSPTTHGYGLGVRCPGVNPKYQDFGWGGAAGAFLAVDLEREISLYFGSHLLLSPAQGARSMLYRMVRAELCDKDDVRCIFDEVEKLYNYSLTY